MGEWRWHTPGWVDDDLPQSVHDAWHFWHAKRAKVSLASMIALLPDGVDPDVVPYVDPLCGAIPEVRTSTPIDWEGFPEQAETRFGPDVMKEVEDRGSEDHGDWEFIDGDGNALPDELWKTRHRQDEYLEWQSREVDGVLDSVTFVCEGYDYYEFLFNHPDGRQRVVDRYRECTGDNSIRAEDLVAPVDMFQRGGRQVRVFARAGEFNPRNAVNQEAGIVHLSHRANSLGAEVALAITSALPRVDANGSRLDGANEKKLMCCTTGGDPARSSDPRIAALAYQKVNDEAAPARFTLTDPIGLYIKSWNLEALRNPRTGELATRDWGTVLRGKDATHPDDPSDARVLRLHVQAPAGSPVRLGEMELDGDRIQHPGQIAKLIKMHLIADVWPAEHGAPAIPCEGGCCRLSSNGLLEIYGDPGQCRGVGEDAYPGLIVPTVTPVVDGVSPLASMPGGRRTQ